jgi:hypothetical protein
MMMMCSFAVVALAFGGAFAEEGKAEPSLIPTTNCCLGRLYRRLEEQDGRQAFQPVLQAHTPADRDGAGLDGCGINKNNFALSSLLSLSISFSSRLCFFLANCPTYIFSLSLIYTTHVVIEIDKKGV